MHHEWPAQRARQPGWKPQGAFPLRRGCGRIRRATRLPAARRCTPNDHDETRTRRRREQHEPLPPLTGRMAAAATRPAAVGSSRSPPTTRSRSTAASRCAMSWSPTRRGATLDERALERRAAVPRVDGRQPRRRPCRHRPHRARLVGGMVGPGLADRHRPLVRRVRQRARRVPGLHRAGVAASRRRPPVRLALPRRDDPRHGARPGPALPTTSVSSRGTRSSAARWAACRCSSGRSRIRDRVRSIVPDRDVHAGDRPADRVGRDRSPRDPPRPAVARRRLLRRRARRRPGRGPGDRPHGRAGHVPQRQRVHRPLRPRAGRPAARSATGFGLWQRFEVERYLEYHGDKLVRRFDTNSYLVIGKAMDLHDVGRGRGGRSRPRWRASRCRRWRSGISSDMLYPAYQQRQIHELLAIGRGRRAVRRDRLTARSRRVPDQPRSGERAARQVPRHEVG